MYFLLIQVFWTVYPIWATIEIWQSKIAPMEEDLCQQLNVLITTFDLTPGKLK